MSEIGGSDPGHAGAEARKPRILMVSANAYPVMGGVETHVHEVAPRVARAGFDVSILTTDRSGSLPRTELLNGVPTRRVAAYPKERDWYLAPRIYTEISRGDWDLIHCQGYHTFVPPLAMLAALRKRTPYVLTFHSGGHPSASRNRLRGVQRRVLRPFLAHAKRLIAVSDFEAAFFSRELHISPKKFVTIPNGAAFKDRPDAVALDAERPLILSVGRLERYKGHHSLIAALPALLEIVPGARLKILGTGQYEAELRRLAGRSSASDRIEIGSVDPVDRLGMATALMSASLVALLSEYEANPVAVMEALALGRRVLVADTSGLSELATRGLARAIPFNSSPTEIAKAIAEQLKTPEPTELSLPTWDDSADRLIDVYRAVLAR
jgi:glycosyltransferase involved in cell wall biosynthesis